MKIGNTFTTALLAASTYSVSVKEAAVGIKEAVVNANEAVLDRISLWNCSTCTLTFAGIDKILKNDSLRVGIESLATKVCLKFGLADTPQIVCPGIVNYFGDSLLDAASRYILTKDRMCNEILGLCSNPHIEELKVENVAANILSTKPDFLKIDDFINNLYA